MTELDELRAELAKWQTAMAKVTRDYVGQTRRAEKAEAERAALLEQVQHLEAVVERSAHYAAVGREVQKRVNRGEVEGSYLDLRGVKIPRTEART